MSHTPHDPNHHRSRPRQPVTRARSLPHRGVYIRAMVASALHYLCLVGALTCGVMFLMRRDAPSSRLFLAATFAAVITFVVALILRKSARCPLCKGTPLVNSGALPHGRAVRLPLLNHGVTATLSLLCTHQFRCMYCGSLYDLLKPVPKPGELPAQPPQDPPRH